MVKLSQFRHDHYPFGANTPVKLCGVEFELYTQYNGFHENIVERKARV